MTVKEQLPWREDRWVDSGVLCSNPTPAVLWLSDLDLKLLIILNFSLLFCGNLMDHQATGECLSRASDKYEQK